MVAEAEEFGEGKSSLPVAFAREMATCHAPRPGVGKDLVEQMSCKSITVQSEGNSSGVDVRARVWMMELHPVRLDYSLLCASR